MKHFHKELYNNPSECWCQLEKSYGVLWWLAGSLEKPGKLINQLITHRKHTVAFKDSSKSLDYLFHSSSSTEVFVCPNSRLTNSVDSISWFILDERILTYHYYTACLPACRSSSVVSGYLCVCVCVCAANTFLSCITSISLTAHHSSFITGCASVITCVSMKERPQKAQMNTAKVLLTDPANIDRTCAFMDSVHLQELHNTFFIT